MLELLFFYICVHNSYQLMIIQSTITKHKKVSSLIIFLIQPPHNVGLKIPLQSTSFSLVRSLTHLCCYCSIMRVDSFIPFSDVVSRKLHTTDCIVSLVAGYRQPQVIRFRLASFHTGFVTVNI
jgi:hypothetical protein